MRIIGVGASIEAPSRRVKPATPSYGNTLLNEWWDWNNHSLIDLASNPTCHFKEGLLQARTFPFCLGHSLHQIAVPPKQVERFVRAYGHTAGDVQPLEGREKGYH